MSKETQQCPVQKTRGFRFSIVDGLAISLCVASTAALLPEIGRDSWLFAVVLGHFFLFCNVFRVRRNYELIWAGLFLANFCYWRFFSDFAWVWVLGIQTPITLTAIIAEIKSPVYRGIFSKDHAG
jgi:hypothetical protein